MIRPWSRSRRFGAARISWSAKSGIFSAFVLSIIRICGAVLLYEEFKGYPLRKDYPVNLVQPRVPERPVDGTFVDERSRNKLLRLKKSLGSKI